MIMCHIPYFSELFNTYIFPHLFLKGLQLKQDVQRVEAKSNDNRISKVEVAPTGGDRIHNKWCLESVQRPWKPRDHDYHQCEGGLVC